MFNLRSRLSSIFGAAMFSLIAQSAGAAVTHPAVLICSGKNDNAPVYLLQDGRGLRSRLEVTQDAKTGGYVGTYVDVSALEIVAECAKGTSIAALLLPLGGGTVGGGMPTQSTLPTSFTIMTSTEITCKHGQPPPTCRRALWGNFWVPGAMPLTNDAHITQFDFSQTDFNLAASGTHFVHSVLTVSNTGFVRDFQGKGMIIGVANACGGAYSSIVETWQNNPTAGGGFPSLVWPTTCATISPTSNYRFLVGANRDQGVQRWIYPAGSSTPMITALSAVDNYFWSSPNWTSGANLPHITPYPGYSYAGIGASGVAFFVVTPGPIASTEVWSLSFSNVSSVTQP